MLAERFDTWRCGATRCWIPAPNRPDQSIDPPGGSPWISARATATPSSLIVLVVLALTSPDKFSISAEEREAQSSIRLVTTLIKMAAESAGGANGRQDDGCARRPPEVTALVILSFLGSVQSR